MHVAQDPGHMRRIISREEKYRKSKNAMDCHCFYAYPKVSFSYYWFSEELLEY
jgi:hypothetical protein